MARAGVPPCSGRGTGAHSSPRAGRSGLHPPRRAARRRSRPSPAGTRRRRATRTCNSPSAPRRVDGGAGRRRPTSAKSTAPPDRSQDRSTPAPAHHDRRGPLPRPRARPQTPTTTGPTPPAHHPPTRSRPPPCPARDTAHTRGSPTTHIVGPQGSRAAEQHAVSEPVDLLRLRPALSACSRSRPEPQDVVHGRDQA